MEYNVGPKKTPINNKECNLTFSYYGRIALNGIQNIKIEYDKTLKELKEIMLKKILVKNYPDVLFEENVFYEYYDELNEYKKLKIHDCLDDDKTLFELNFPKQIRIVIDPYNDLKKNKY